MQSSVLPTDPVVAEVISRTNRMAPSDLTGFDAVVVGAGAAGNHAAQRLCEAGLNVLVLDAGWRDPFWRAPVRRTVATVLSVMATPKIVEVVPRKLLWKGEQVTRLAGAVRQPVQTRCYAWPSAPEQFVDDVNLPYETPEGRPFDWIRCHGPGGRMVVPLHGRQYLRHSSDDFEARDGRTPAWPFPPATLDPYYDEAERQLGLSGCNDHSPYVPESRIAQTLELRADERDLIAAVQGRYPGYTPVLGRYAPPAKPLAGAARTGRLACRSGAAVRHVLKGADGRAEGVVWHDRITGRLETVRAPLVFLCASTLESTRILLMTRQESGVRSEDDGPLGRYLMDHAHIKAEGTAPGMGASTASPEFGRCLYLPRYDRRNGHAEGRGYGVRVYRSPAAGNRSYFVVAADAEMLPRADNRVRLSSRTDARGFPILNIDCTHGPHELAAAPKLADAICEIFELAGASPDRPIAPHFGTPGSTIHECGTARMGNDPATSVLNPYNECWDMPGLRVTDGACFPSQGIQNPTLTILALTARACDDAVRLR